MKNAGRFSLPILSGSVILAFGLLLASQLSAQTCTLPPAGLVSWWPGDGDASDIVDGNSGALVGGATFGPGFVGQAFDLNGSSGYIRVADHPSLDTPDGFTVDAWIYPRAYGGPRVIASKWDDPTGQWSWIFKLHNDGSGRLRIEISRGDHNALGDLGGVTILPLHTWSHVAATYDRLTSRLRLYVNGRVDNEGLARFPGVAVNNSATDLLIGAVNAQIFPPGTEHFHGLIDELELFNRALTTEEIRAILSAGRAGKCKVTAVAIDIKPGSFPNSINPKSQGKIPVAILSSATFNAPGEVDQGSLKFGRTGDEPSLAFCNPNGEDVNGDGLLDLVCHFHTQTAAFQPGDTQGILEGKTVSGTPLTGTDSVRIVPSR